MKKKNNKHNKQKTAAKSSKKVTAHVSTDNRFKVFSALSNDAIIIHKNGIIIDANSAACKLVGIPEKKIIGANALSIIPKKYHKEVMARFTSDARGAQKMSFINKDGKAVWVDVRGKNIKYNGEQVRVTIFTNITEQILFEEKLKESEQKFRRLSEATFEAILIHDNGKLIDYNDSAKRMFGYTDKEMIGKSVLEFATPESRPIVLEKIKSNFTLPYEAIGLRKNGTDFFGEILAKNIALPDGKSIRVGAIRDITDRKKIERELRESEANLSMILKNIEELVYYVEFDDKGKQQVRYIGEQIIKLIGVNQQDYIKNSSTLIEYCHHDDIDKIKNAYAQIKRNLKPQTHTFRFRHFKTGKYVWLEEHIIPQVDRTGKHLGNFGVLRDITEQKMYELEIEQSRENYRNLIEYSPDGIFIHNVKGNILFANPRMLEMMGISSLKKLPSNHVLDYLDPEHVQAVKKRKENILKGISSPFTETRIKRPDGKNIEVESKAIPIVYNNEQCILVVCHNIDVEKQLKRELFRANEAEKANRELQDEITERKKAEQELQFSLREKEVLIKEVHHRVKNNLQVISSILNLQSSYVKDENTLQILKESQNRIKSMAFIHESLYQNKDLSSINFSEYVLNLCQNLVHSFELFDNQVTLEFELSEIRLNLDTAIPTGLIINELISNALKYAFPNKSKGTVHIKLDQKKDTLSLVISDNGIGFPQKLNFRKTDSLGLQLVTTLVEQLNGTITLGKGPGTTFTIKLKIQNK